MIEIRKLVSLEIEPNGDCLEYLNGKSIEHISIDCVNRVRFEMPDVDDHLYNHYLVFNTNQIQVYLYEKNNADKLEEFHIDDHGSCCLEVNNIYMRNISKQESTHFLKEPIVDGHDDYVLVIQGNTYENRYSEIKIYTRLVSANKEENAS